MLLKSDFVPETLGSNKKAMYDIPFSPYTNLIGKILLLSSISG